MVKTYTRMIQIPLFAKTLLLLLAPLSRRRILLPGSHSGSRSANSTFTVEQAIDHVGFGTFQYLLLGYAGLAWMAEAMELMLLSFVGPAVLEEWGLSNAEESFISSAVFAGMLVGAYSWGILSDTRGRR